MTTPRQEGVKDGLEKVNAEQLRDLIKIFRPNMPDFEIKFKEAERDLGHPLTSKETLKILEQAVKEELDKEKESADHKVVKIGEDGKNLDDFLQENPGWEPVQTVNQHFFLAKKKD